ncbi:MAG: B12-binding domain-containing radical SAM protein [Nitrospina sp.]|nr:B12-binding domain-containing radical SAM protein [Nitrospina sp.]
MKILLVQPKSSGFMGQISKSGKAGFARVTLTTLAALNLDENEVHIHDARLREPDYNEDWDLVGFTGMTCEIPHVYRMADSFRKKGKTVVIGGYHASALPEEALQHADFVVVGEAEGLWSQILKEVDNGGPKQKIYKNSKPVKMCNMAIPRRDLLDLEMYSVPSTIQATRGCPFNCEFCTVTKFFGRSYRTRPVDEVIDEIKSRPDKLWMFLDDNLVGDPAYAKSLLKALIPLNLTWGAQTSFTITTDPELMDLYQAAGGRYAFIGFESITADTLNSIRKRFNKPDKYAEGVKELHRRGITIMGSFIFGLDGDDMNVFKRTVDFVNAAKIDIPLYNILTPFPGTQLYQRMEDEGRIIDRDWANYDVCHAVIQPKNMTPEELLNGYFWAVRETYRLPNILHRIVRFQKGWKWRLAASYSYMRKAYKFCSPANNGLTPNS